MFLLHVLLDLLLRALPYVATGAMFAVVATLMIRRDLVELALANGLSWKDKLNADPYWTDGSELLPGFRVAPVVRAQIMANRVQRFRTERLENLGKRMDKVEKQLKKSIREGRISRLAYRLVSDTMRMLIRMCGSD